MAKIVTGEIDARIAAAIRNQAYSKEETDGKIDFGFHGEAVPTTVPTTVQLERSGKWEAYTEGIYTDMGGIEIDEDDLADGRLIQIIYTKETDTWSKVFVGQNLSGYLQSAKIDASVYTEGNQLFDKDKMVVPNRFISTVDSNEYTESGAALIVITPSTDQITVSGILDPLTGIKAARWTDEVGTFVGSHISIAAATQTFIRPSGATTLRLTAKRAVNGSTWADALMVNEGSIALPYEDFIGGAYVKEIEGKGKVVTPQELNNRLKISAVLSEDKEVSPGGNQLFDKATMILENRSVLSDGTLGTESGAKVAQIQRNGLTNIYIDGIVNYTTLKRGSFMNAEGEVIGSVSNFGTASGYARTFPDGAVVFNITIARPSYGDDTDTLMVNAGNFGLPYEPFVPATTEKVLTEINGAKVYSPSFAVRAESQGTQLFDKNTMIKAGWFVISNGQIATESGANMLSIPIRDDVKIVTVSGIPSTSAGARFGRWAKADGTPVNYYFTITSGQFTVSKPEGAAALDFTVNRAADSAADFDDIMVNEGYTALEYDDYASPEEVKIANQVGDAQVSTIYKEDVIAVLNTMQPYRGQKMVTLGDSITQMTEWQQTLANYLGVTWSSQETIAGVGGNPRMGIGGSRIVPLIQSGQTGKNATESIYYRADYVHEYHPDLILLMGGQNDGFSAPYNILDAPYTGPEVTTSPPSFAASYKGTIEKLINNNPRAKIVCLSNMYTNTVALNSATRAQYEDKFTAMRDMAGLYGLQFIDLLHNTGISYLTHSVMNRPSDPVHPGNLGGLMMARYIASQLQ